MRLTLLGTGTPAPSARRAASGYVVEAAGETFVFDHGPGAHARMLQSGIPVTAVTRLFVSHFHYDHFADAASLVLRRWDQGGGKLSELAIYGPPPAKRIFALMFGPGGVFEADLDARTKNAASVALYHARGGIGIRARPAPIVMELNPGDIIREDRWAIRTVQTPHTQPQLVSLAFRLDCNEGSLVYSGDTGPCEALVEIARGADVLIHMCHYISGTEFNEAMTWGCAGHKLAAEHAQKAGVGTLVLTHLTDQVAADGNHERVLQDIGRIYNGRVIWGEDLKQIEVSDLKSRKIESPL